MRVPVGDADTSTASVYQHVQGFNTDDEVLDVLAADMIRVQGPVFG